MSMDTLMSVVNANIPTFTNKKLNQATQKIAKISSSIRKNLYEIAIILAAVDADETYKDDGFKSAAEYAQTTFNFKKSMAYTLIRVGKEYTAPTLESNLPHEDGKDFTVSQVEKLLPLNSYQAAVELVEEGKITPEMSCKQIAKIVKAETAEPVDESTTEPAEESTTEPEDDQPVEVNPKSCLDGLKSEILRLIGEITNYTSDNVILAELETLSDELVTIVAAIM